jgi:hypothetical protein
VVGSEEGSQTKALTNGVVTGEAIGSQSHLQAGNEVIHTHGSGEVVCNLNVPAWMEGQNNTTLNSLLNCLKLLHL